MGKAISPHAAAAKMIRGELKAAYPTVAFKVRSESYSGGDSVRVEWTDGPTDEQIDAIIGKYEYGRFDGTIDLYEYTNKRDDIPQVKFTFSNRSYSRDAYAAAIAETNRHWGWNLTMHPEYIRVDHESDGPRGNGSGWQSQDVYRLIHVISLLCPTGHALLPGDRYCPECGADLEAAAAVHAAEEQLRYAMAD